MEIGAKRGWGRAAVLAALCLGGASCVTPGDLERRDVALERYQEQADRRLADFQAGVLTREQYREEQRQSGVDLRDELASITEDVKARTTAALEAAKSGTLITGAGPLGDMAATALLSVFGVNAYRNRKRKERNEPV